jgi:hypothetical protein
MIKIISFILVSMAVISCNNNPKDVVTDNRIALRTDTINIVKLTDTLVIYESTCRGCAYERSTNFAISDSMNMIRLMDVITTDNSPADMDGGSINKDLVLVPVKPGTTIMKLFKFWTEEKAAADSARFVSYKIEVKQ